MVRQERPKGRLYDRTLGNSEGDGMVRHWEPEQIYLLYGQALGNLRGNLAGGLREDS